MAKSALYTRTGDKGTTSLVYGQRVKKNSARIESYGTIDELSSALGMTAASPDCNDELRGQIRTVQNELFNIGSYLATDPGEGQPACASLADGTRLQQLEEWIDSLDEQTPKTHAFVLPGGSPGAAACHLARTICRRAERRILTLAETEYVDPNVTRYVNRLSDYLFIAARYINFVTGVDEVIWKQ